MDDGRVVGGRYQLGRRIGAGGMGTVWRAYDLRLHREVAVKEIRVPSTMSDEMRADLNRRAMLEARSAARLNHPNIVSVHDVLVESDETWIVMNLVNGHSLHDAVLGQGRLDPAQAATLGLGLLNALDAAHAAGIVHRDVKPSNVLLPATGGVLLTDFSIAALVDAATVTANSLLLGTPGYVAPERVTSGRSGPPADLFGLGATLYFATEAHGPFDRPDPLAQLFATANDTPEPPQYAGPLLDVIAGLLVKDPDRRWTSAQCRRALEAIRNLPATASLPANTRPASEAPTVWYAALAPSPPSPTPAPAPSYVPPSHAAASYAAPVPPADGTTVTVRSGLEGPRRRSRMLLIGLIVLALVAAGGVATYWMGDRPPAGPSTASNQPTADERLGQARPETAAPTESPSPSPTVTAGPTQVTTTAARPPAAPAPAQLPATIGMASYGGATYGLAWLLLPYWHAGENRWHTFIGGVTHGNTPDERAIVHDTSAGTTPASFSSQKDVTSIAKPAIHEAVAFIVAGGTYYLYYFQFADLGIQQGPIYLATSTDLQNWQLRGVVISDTLQLRGGFNVIAYGGQYLAFSATSAGTVVRTSTNLINWSAPASVGVPLVRVCGVFAYNGKWYLAGAVNATGDARLIRAANPNSFASGEHIQVPRPSLDPAWEGPLSYVVIGSGNQPIAYGESGWWATLSWTV